MNKTQTTTVNQQVSALEDMIAKLETLRDELQESYDNKSEKWQDSDEGSAMQCRIDNLKSAISGMEDAKGYLEKTVEQE